MDTNKLIEIANDFTESVAKFLLLLAISGRCPEDVKAVVMRHKGEIKRLVNEGAALSLLLSPQRKSLKLLRGRYEDQLKTADVKNYFSYNYRHFCKIQANINFSNIDAVFSLVNLMTNYLQGLLEYSGENHDAYHVLFEEPGENDAE